MKSNSAMYKVEVKIKAAYFHLCEYQGIFMITGMHYIAAERSQDSNFFFNYLS